MPDNQGIHKNALYCRTAQQSDIGIERQKERLTRFADDNGYLNPSWYIDDGESGLTLNRPAMNQLIKDIRAGVIHTVIVTGCDRIARGYEVMSEWMRLLQETDARCVSLDNGGHDIKSEFIDFSELMCTRARRKPYTR
jgi:DNA invertase Pin-like site-specific DNA recombinase